VRLQACISSMHAHACVGGNLDACMLLKIGFLHSKPTPNYNMEHDPDRKFLAHVT